MADITMCKGEFCPLRETCFRYKAVPNPFWQSYFTRAPYQDNRCAFYVSVDGEERAEEPHG